MAKFAKFNSTNCSIQSDNLKVSFIDKELAIIQNNLTNASNKYANNTVVNERISKVSYNLQKLKTQNEAIADMWKKLYDYYLKKKENCKNAEKKQIKNLLKELVNMLL